MTKLKPHDFNLNVIVIVNVEVDASVNRALSHRHTSEIDRFL